MTSLREEIYKLIYPNLHEKDGYKDSFLVDDILKLFEKRIDQQINEIQDSINSFTPECGYAMLQQSDEKRTIIILEEIKKWLK